MDRRVKQNRQHYDSVTDAWRLILGENFHWGLFRDEADDLETATDRLISAMAALVPSLQES